MSNLCIVFYSFCIIYNFVNWFVKHILLKNLFKYFFSCIKMKISLVCCNSCMNELINHTLMEHHYIVIIYIGFFYQKCSGSVFAEKNIFYFFMRSICGGWYLIVAARHKWINVWETLYILLLYDLIVLVNKELARNTRMVQVKAV